MVHQRRKPQTTHNEFERLRRENEVLEKTFDGIHVLIAYMDRDFNFIRVNRNYARADGKTPEFFVGKNHFALYPHAENEAIFRRVVETGEPYYAYEKPFTYPDRPGQVTWWDWTLQPMFDDGRVEGVLLSLINVTERVRSRMRAEREEAHFRALFEQAADAILILEPDSSRFLEVNPAAARLFGIQGHVTGKNTLGDFAADSDAGVRIRSELARAVAEGVAEFIAHLNNAEGHLVIASISAKLVAQENGDALLCICRDVTEQMQAKERLQRLNRALETISACNRALVRTDDPRALLESICLTLADSGGFMGAAAYLLGSDGIPAPAPMASAGKELPALKDDVGGTTVKELIVEAAASMEQRILCPASHRKPVAVFPLHDGEKPVGALVLRARSCSAFDDMQVELLLELAEDASFGLAAMRVRRERQEKEELLQRTFEATIQAIATAVEMRDPYTAGHQRRVADLATEIGRRLGLPEDEVLGIHMAGLIHDLGKISIPAEILNRPGRLTKVEFDIIKGHAQAGYDIIKGVELPWPVADMVLHHHERLDGSGYPNGLKGDEISLGARILAVADVVEAITSHRPYRPGRGIETALAEIEENRGRLYDGAVVDACVDVFRDGFTFKP